MRRGDLSELLPGNCVAQNLNMGCANFNIPAGFPGAGTPAPNNNFAPYMHPLGQVLASLYPAPNISQADNRYNYNFHYAAADQPRGLQVPHRLQHHEQDAGLRANGDRARERRERAWHLVGVLRRGAADADLWRQQGTVGVGQRRQRAEPDHDERSRGELEPADTGQLLARSLQGSHRRLSGAGGPQPGLLPESRVRTCRSN